MKIMIRKIFTLGLVFTAASLIAQVGIGTTSPTGALDIQSTVNGFLPPRLALTATNVQAPVVNPQGGALPAGTIVWNTATAGTSPTNVGPGLYYWDGTKWVAFAGSPGGLDWTLTGNSGTSAGTNFLGTTDTQDLRVRTNNTEAFRVRSDQNIAINDPGNAFTQVYIQSNNPNDAINTRNNDGIANGLWAVNDNATGTAILGAVNGTGGVFPTVGAAVSGSAVNGVGVYGNTGNGTPNVPAHNGHVAGMFILDSDNDPDTTNDSAMAQLAGKDEAAPGFDPVTGLALPAARLLYGGYFRGGVSSQSFSYVGLKYAHDNNATATGGTDFKIIGNGVVSTIVRDKNNIPRIMFAPESPEVLFQDYGVGQLQNGQAEITIDETLSKNILVDDKHPLKVFIQLEGDCNGVYVTSKSQTGFVVKELSNGNSSVKFSWQIVATRADRKDSNGNILSHTENLRFPIGPEALEAPRKLSKKTKRK